MATEPIQIEINRAAGDRDRTTSRLIRIRTEAGREGMIKDQLAASKVAIEVGNSRIRVDSMGTTSSRITEDIQEEIQEVNMEAIQGGTRIIGRTTATTRTEMEATGETEATKAISRTEVNPATIMTPFNLVRTTIKDRTTTTTTRLAIAIRTTPGIATITSGTNLGKTSTTTSNPPNHNTIKTKGIAPCLLTWMIAMDRMTTTGRTDSLSKISTSRTGSLPIREQGIDTREETAVIKAETITVSREEAITDIKEEETAVIKEEEAITGIKEEEAITGIKVAVEIDTKVVVAETSPSTIDSPATTTKEEKEEEETIVIKVEEAAITKEEATTNGRTAARNPAAKSPSKTCSQVYPKREM